MRKEVKTIFKGITILMILFAQSLLQAQTVTNIQCQNSLPMQDPIRLKIINDGATLTNAISTSESTVIENDGVNNITVYIKTVKIPYYDNFLTGRVNIETSSFCTYTQSGINSSVQAKLVVNGSQMPGNTYNSTINFAVGSHNFNTSAKCSFPLGSSHICSKKYFRITVIKEPVPNYNISFSRYCMTDNTNQYNGYIGIRVNGTITNLNNRLYLKTTNTSNTCLAGSSTNLGTTGTGSYNNLTFYNCVSSGTYTTKLIYSYINIVGSLISREIPTGENGWIGNYVFTKSIVTCLPVMDPEDPKFVIKSAASQVSVFPNPTKDNVTLNIEKEDKLISYSIFENSGLMVKKGKFTTKSNEETINISDLRKGIYLISVETEKTSFREKIIKE